MKKVNGTESCVRCDCNGNEHPGANPVCDMKSGICLQCVHNATGIKCEKCANGYEGDAIVAKNCSLIQHQSPGMSFLVFLFVNECSCFVFGLLGFYHGYTYTKYI